MEAVFCEALRWRRAARPLLRIGITRGGIVCIKRFFFGRRILFFWAMRFGFYKIEEIFEIVYILHLLCFNMPYHRVGKSAKGSRLGEEDFIANAMKGASAFNDYFTKRTGSKIEMSWVDEGLGSYKFATNNISPRGLSKIIGVVELWDNDYEDDGDDEDNTLSQALPYLKDLSSLFLEISQSKFAGLVKGMDMTLRAFYTASYGSKKYGETEKFTIGEGSPVAIYTKHMIALLTAILCRKKDYAENKIAEIRPLFDDLLAEGETQGEGRICKNEGEFIKYADMIKGMYENNAEFMKDADCCNWWDIHNDISTVSAMEQLSSLPEELAGSSS